jgi:hypothetical protein
MVLLYSNLPNISQIEKPSAQKNGIFFFINIAYPHNIDMAPDTSENLL